MGKMSELELMVKELRGCGEKLIRMAEEMTEMFSASGQSESEETPKKQLSLTEVRAVLAEKSRAGFTKEVKALLIKHGADKLSEINPAEYEALLAEAEVLGNGYRYVESPEFEILLFAVSVNGSPVVVYDLARGDVLPNGIIMALVDDSVTKWAFNAAFERICLSEYLRRKLPELMKNKYLCPESWKCSMIWSAYMGLSLSLEGAGSVLGLEEQKLKEGKDLIRYFCVPCKPTKTNGGRTRNLPVHNMEKWELFKAYNKQDVEVEMSIQQKLHKFPVPDFVWEEYHMDQRINDRGIALDWQVVENAIQIDAISEEELLSAMKEITKLENPNSVLQMRGWLLERGVETDSLCSIV